MSDALAIVTAAKNNGALVFANVENMEAKVELYRTEVTQLVFTEKDFHTINGKKMPNKASTDRIGEACGVQFIQNACRVTAETRDDDLCGKRTVYCAEAQGKIRMPDGSWRTSTVDEYEFDPVLRAMLDKNIIELNKDTRKTIAKAILEYEKVARQRAATGARLRVIRQLTGMPAAFEPNDASKPMVFTRVVQNTSYILQTPEGRALATAQALGCDIASLFGGRPSLPSASETSEEKNSTLVVVPEPEAETEGDDDGNATILAAEAAGDDVDFPPEGGEAQQKETAEFQDLSVALEEYKAFVEYLDVTTKSGNNPYQMLLEELSNKSATVESRKNMISRIRDFLIAKKVPGVV